jgi:hypothetical protein
MKKGIGYSRLKEELGMEGYKKYKGIKRFLYKPIVVIGKPKKGGSIRGKGGRGK